MRKQYQGQLSASMLYYSLCGTSFSERFFFCAKIILESEKQKNTAISCGVDFKMVTSAGLANIKLSMYTFWQIGLWLGKDNAPSGI